MLKRARTQTETITWSASGEPEINLVKDGIITHVDVVLELTPSASMAADGSVDALARTVTNFTIKGGEQTFFGLPPQQGGRLLHYMNKQMYPGMVFHGLGAITAPLHTYIPFLLRFHCGSRPYDAHGEQNPFDLTAFINGPQQSSLRIAWRTGANNVMDPTITLASAVARITVYEVLGTPAEIMAEMQQQGIRVGSGGIMNSRGEALGFFSPRWNSFVLTPTAAAADYSYEHDIPTGGFLRGVYILAQNDTAIEAGAGSNPLRAADEVTGIAIKMAGRGGELVKVFSDALNLGWTPVSSNLILDAGAAATVNVDFNLAAAHGFYPLNLKKYGQTTRDYGIDMRPPIGVGDFKLGLTITEYASGDDFLVTYDQVLNNQSIVT